MTFDKGLLRRYKKLQWHRCLLVEAMRVIAFRNLEHMNASRVALAVTDWADPIAFDLVPDSMLLDQGIEPTRQCRFVPGWAGRASKAIAAEYPEVRSGPLEELLHAVESLVEHLGGLRDIRLHSL